MADTGHADGTGAARGESFPVCATTTSTISTSSVGGEPMLIDWEYAGSGDPAFDLASVCVYHRYGPAQRSLLLDAYGAAGRGVDAGRLGRACWIFEYVRDLWTAVRGLDEANR